MFTHYLLYLYIIYIYIIFFISKKYDYFENIRIKKKNMKYQ